jgi:branched-subunit amino acid transport protein
MNALLGGQLTGLPPEVALGLSPKWQMILAAFFAAFSLVCAFVFMPILRRDRVARFWAAVMLLALVPAATVVPLSKNLGFVAVGAFGVMAAFLTGLVLPQVRAVRWGPGRGVAWCVAVWFILAHVAGALAARAVLAKASPLVPAAWEYWCDIEASPPIGGRDLVALNDFTVIMLPFDRLYRGKPLPNNVRLLVPGVTPFEVNRVDASTLILKAKGVDLFDSPPLGPLHLGYAINAGNELFLGGRTWAKGDRVMRKGFMAEVLELSARGAPREVAFHFDKPLDSDEMVWLYFDWRRHVTSQFALPRVGETVEIRGPRGWHRGPKNAAAAADPRQS